MALFCIIETDDGWLITEHAEPETAQQAAERCGGVVIDPGPYHNYEDAYDALIALQEDLADDEKGDLPGTQALEGRYETDD